MKEQSATDTINSFLFRYRENLQGTLVLAAVSGGADSVALLHLLHALSPSFGFSLHAMTVNHRIRSEAESSGDADFVETLCSSLVPPIPCHRLDLEEGQCEREAAQRGKGLEEAARHLRYAFFEACKTKFGASWIMTGHTADDQSETMLMRVLQGSEPSALSGIQSVQGSLMRPLLALTHSDLIAYLRERNLSWREDATNADASFLRNRVRLNLLPVLDGSFPGWRTALSRSAEQAACDENFFEGMLTLQWNRAEGGIWCDADSFYALHESLAFRFLKRGLLLLAPKARFSRGFLLELIHSPGEKRGCGLVWNRVGSRIEWKADIVHKEKTGYLVSVQSSCFIDLPVGRIKATVDGEYVRFAHLNADFPLPVLIRSRHAGDKLVEPGGKTTTLKKLFSAWGIPESERDVIPLVISNGKIAAVWGSLLGYRNVISESKE